MALDELLDEHEQSERVLAWLRRNGGSMLGGILLGLALIGGWKWWEQRQAGQQAAVADRFQQSLDAINAGDATAPAKVNALPQGEYRALAALNLAKAGGGRKEWAADMATLKSVQSEDPVLGEIVHGGLANVLVDAKKADEALRVLGTAQGPAAMEARGDAQFALGQLAEARTSYSQALTRLDVDAPQRRVLELKLTQVGGTPNKPEARS